MALDHFYLTGVCFFSKYNANEAKINLLPEIIHKQASYSDVLKSPNASSLKLHLILREELKSLFSDPVFLEAQCKALVSELRRETEELKQRVKERDVAITSPQAIREDLTFSFAETLP